jgi:CheY-like chemotaxis protein
MGKDAANVGGGWLSREASFATWRGAFATGRTSSGRRSPAAWLGKAMPRILVIDDIDIARHAAVRLLAAAGYHDVCAVPGGLAGIRLWRELGADLVITDLNMPEVNGVEVILALRALAPDLPILAMSGDPDSVDLLQACEAFLLGPVQLLTKPFTQRELVSAVATALRARSSD